MSSDTSRLSRQIGNYDLISKIAEGGMGAVYRGRNRATGEVVAIKIIPAETARNPLLLKRFEQEFKAASLIDHPNVVKAIDYCGTGATPFLVMEFVDGESLGARIERDGVIPEAEAIRIVGQVCEGLHRAHKQGLIHRDVKPDNILLTADGVAKLTDLGLVKDVEGEMNLTKTGRGLGTPHFMAPEQFRDAKNADVRCDVYSLGATLYTMVTAEIPFDKTSPLDCWLKKTKNDFAPPKRRNPLLSDRADWAIRRAMHHDPAQRPASCREFMEDLTGSGWRTQQNSGLVTPGSGPNTEPPLPPAEDIWYMVYRDGAQQLHTVKGLTESIRKNLMAGVLGDIATILVSRTKTGQFQPLRGTPEFRDIVLQYLTANDPAAPPGAPAGPRSGRTSRQDTPGVTKLPTLPSGGPLRSTAGEPKAPSGVRPGLPSKSPSPASTQVYAIRPISTVSDSGTATPLAPPEAAPRWLPYAVLGFALAVVLLALIFVATQ